MKILIIRHGDPDYSIDSLTEKGWREAELLAPRLMKMGITDVFVSPLGRARDTARPFLEASGKTARVLDWLREFPASVDPDKFYLEKGLAARGDHCPWNLLPEYWRSQSEMFDEYKWRGHPLYAESNVGEVYDIVERKLRACISSFGYTFDGDIFRIAEGANEGRVVAFFCHMGLGLSLIASLTRAPLPLIWESFFLPTTSVTTVFMEKHPPYIDRAQARLIQVGDTSHLALGGEPVSSSGLHWHEHF